METGLVSLVRLLHSKKPNHEESFGVQCDLTQTTYLERESRMSLELLLQRIPHTGWQQKADFPTAVTLVFSTISSISYKHANPCRLANCFGRYLGAAESVEPIKRHDVTLFRLTSINIPDCSLKRGSSSSNSGPSPPKIARDILRSDRNLYPRTLT
ncbi:hypothetical protein GW17_00028227 [Ensete ventricosum]|nr:hypothetical protein GW17_00028227 [Ensete ventricosum]